jgi:ureidoglycolate lyase
VRDPTAPSRLRSFAAHELKLVKATPETLRGYDTLATDFAATPVEIVTWPAQGWRPVDPDTGNQGGTVEGIFEFWWSGEVFYGRNNAVGDSYLVGWSCDPERASESAAAPDRSELLIWHANYHPDGGQLFFPREGKPFVAPLALPGDDVTPDKFVAFYFDGSCGLYIHPGVWHEAVFPLAERGTFLDRQGAVHARVSCDFVKEFGTYLRVPMRAP